MKFWQKCLLYAVKQGGYPKHIVFIMDGNRRFARKLDQEPTHGHVKGSMTLESVLEWCYEVGIEVISAFAFSVDNFQRPAKEVNGLFQLCLEKFQMLLEGDALKKYNARLQILGDLNLVPKQLRKMMARAMDSSRNNKGTILNIYFAYSSELEINCVGNVIREGVTSGMLLPEDIDDSLIQQCLFMGDCHPPDMFVRTSGEYRLSDFMLWQLKNACLCFFPVMWPELTLTWFIRALLEYQISRPFITKPNANIRNVQCQRRIDQFIEQLYAQREAEITNLCDYNECC